jgi:aspartyl-tRNA(Asn)/glutamyl-tRNA(Gln) amidotransferase subunit C
VTLDDALLDYLAHLARLRLPPEERERLREDLTRILAYVAILDEVDVGEPPAPADPVPEDPVLREDVTVPPLAREEALAPAPEVLEGHFAVPAVVQRELRPSSDGGG